MTSPTKLKLSEQQLRNNNNSTVSPISTVSAGIAEEQAQGGGGAAVPAPVTHDTGADNLQLEQVQGEPSSLALGTATEDIPIAPIVSFQPEPTEAVTTDLVTATTLDTSDGDENRMIKAQDEHEADETISAQAVLAASSDSAHGNEEDCIMTDDAAISGSGDRGNRSPSTPASIELDHINAEHSGPATPELTSGSSGEDADELMTPSSTGFGPEDGDFGSPVATTSVGAARIDEETRYPLTASPPSPEDGNEENSSALTSASTVPDDGNVDSSQAQRVTPMVSEQAVEETDGAMSFDPASEIETPGPSEEDEEDTENDSKEDKIPEKSSLPMETQPETTSRERDAHEPALTPALDTEESGSEADLEFYHTEEEVELSTFRGARLPLEIPESPLRSGSPYNEDHETSDHEQGEAQGQAVTPASDFDGPASRSDAMTYHDQEEVNLYSSDISETPLRPRGRLGEDPHDFDHSQPEIKRFPSEIPETPLQSAQSLGGDPAKFELDEGGAVASPVDRASVVTGHLRPEVNGKDDLAEGTQGGESSNQGKQSKGKSRQLSVGETISAGESPHHIGSGDLFGTLHSKDGKTIHLRLQYLVACSRRSKASICISVPEDLAYTAFKQTILDALHQHDGTRNPRPAHTEAVISRLLLVMARMPSDPPTFHSVIELTDANLQPNLVLIRQRSIYDFVKVEFVRETNGETRPTKATGKVNGRAGKVGGL